tara:strand:+ start:1313 stop:1474 length:162 start_codon:yes stop_codon:yes gene_type:complete
LFHLPEQIWIADQDYDVFQQEITVFVVKWLGAGQQSLAGHHQLNNPVLWNDIR